MSQHQLPCEHCGQVIPVTVTMAGRAVTCPHCGHQMTAPKLGLIRSLPLVPSQSVRPPREKRWSAESGLLFSVGFFLLLIGAIGTSVSYYSYRTPATELAGFAAEYPDGKLPDFNDLSEFEEVSAAIPVDQLWQDWREGLKSNLNEWRPFRTRYLLDKMDEIQQYVTGFSIVTGLGLLMVIASFFFLRKSPVQAR